MIPKSSIGEHVICRVQRAQTAAIRLGMSSVPHAVCVPDASKLGYVSMAVRRCPISCWKRSIAFYIADALQCHTAHTSSLAAQLHAYTCLPPPARRRMAAFIAAWHVPVPV